MICSILIIAFCSLKYGINKHILLLKSWSVSFWNIWMFCLLVVEDEASLPSLQNPLQYLIISHINPVYAFITHLYDSLWPPDPLNMLEQTELS